MATTFGKYHSTHQLYRSAFARVMVAQSAVAAPEAGAVNGKYVVKQFELPEVEQIEIGENAVALFVERTTVQRKIAAAGAAHWATVHDSGDADGRPFLVTDYFPRSAQKLIAGHVALGATGLYEIISGVVEGLRELKALCGRAHGNLKPSNILIRGAAEAGGGGKIALIDPSPEPCIGASAEGDDLHAIGALIYHLVMGRALRHAAWPIKSSREWTVLGRYGERWRQLCDDLLDPDPQRRPSLESLAEKVAELKPRHVPWLKILAPFAAAIVLLLAAHVFQSAARNEVAGKYDSWLGAVLEDTGRLKRLDAASAHPPIVPPTERQAIETCRLAGASWGSVWPSPDPYRAKAAVSHIRARLLEAYGQTQTRAARLGERCQAMGWAQPAGYFKAVAAAEPPMDADLARVTEDRLARLDRLEPPAGLVGQWTRLNALLAKLQSRGDADLMKFAAVLRGSAANAITVDDAGWKSAHDLFEIALAEQVIEKAENQANVWPVDFDRNRMASVESLSFDHPTIADIRKWVQTVDHYAAAKPPELAERDRTIKAWQITLDATDRDIAAAPSEWFSRPGEKEKFAATTSGPSSRNQPAGRG